MFIVFLQKIKSFFERPFKHDFYYTVVLWIVLSVPTVYHYFVIGNQYYCLYVLLYYYMWAYIIEVFIGHEGFIWRCLKTVVLLLLLLLNLVRLVGMTKFGMLLPGDAIATVLQTNTQETVEFLRANFSMGGGIEALGVLGAFFFLCLFCIWRKQSSIVNRYVRYCAMGGVVLSVAAVSHNPYVRHDASIYADIKNAFENSVDLREHLCNPEIEETNNMHPENIVVILGESFSRYHSSLYGYEKNTNPLLSKLVADSSLYVFENVESPCTSTTPSFKYIMNTFSREQLGKWYENPTIIEVFNIAGYHTAWISNQQQYGLWDNICSSYSAICDERFFTDMNGTRFDEEVISLYKNNARKMGKSLTFFHFLGQHAVFSERYPSNYDLLKSEDYINKPDFQRENLATYDNATIYNDYVVHSIIECFKDRESIVFYFPDHGTDIYYTNNYCAHGKPNDPISDKMSRDIPFMIYMSDSFKENYPTIVNKVKESLNNKYCTEYFIYTIMDIAGYKFVNNPNVYGKSILSNE